MKLLNAFSFLIDLRLAILAATFPTLKALLQKPELLWKPQEISRIFMSHVWAAFGDGVDEGGSVVKKDLITPNAHGVVLDIGAGYGHTARYLNHARVKQYVALEPNVLMHSVLREQANKAGFHESDGTLVIISCGIEDTQQILSTLSTSSDTPPIDTLISILTLCTIPDPQKNITKMLRDLLKSGGQFLMYEHVLSKRKDVAWWQRLWAPVWACAFDGCRMDRASDDVVTQMKVPGQNNKSMWREWRTWGKEGEDPEALFWHIVGRFVKD